MELRHLRYFVTIAEERSFTGAAERLWIAQPGLSSQIRRLESELGVRLFERHTRGVDLTAAGECFLERARATLAAAEGARATGRDVAAGLVGTLRLGLVTEMPSALTPSVLATFIRTRPDVELGVVESYGGMLLRELRDGRLDAVIAPSEFGSADLRTVRLASEPWVVLVGRRHRLWTGASIGADLLHGEPIVITGQRDGAAYDRLVTELLNDFGVVPVLVHGAPGPALRSEVVAGEALALTTAAAYAGGEVRIRTLEPVRRVHFSLLCRNETPSPVLRELIRVAAAGAVPSRRRKRPVLAAVA